MDKSDSSTDIEDPTPKASPSEEPRPPQEGRLGVPEGTLGDGADLDPNAEVDLWVGRTRWQHFAGRIALWVGGNIAAAVLVFWITSKVEGFHVSHGCWVVLGLVAVSACFVPVPIFARIISHRYRLTSQRLFVERGILSQTIDQTELIRVDDVRVHKTLTDRIFGLGSVAVLSTDMSDREIVIAGIHAPEKVAEHIRSQMRAMRSKALFVENL